MRKKAAPGEGTDRRAEQFSYTPTPFGVSKAWTAWCAGEPYWCKVHEHTKVQPGTKVCVGWYTDGALICPRCKPAVVPTTVCYVPVYRELDHRPCLVIVHESAADLLADVGFGTRVLIGCVERGASVFVRPAENQSPMATENPLRKVPCDLTLTLMTLWGYPQLQQWELEQSRAAPPTKKVNALVVPTEPGDGVPLLSNRLADAFDASADKSDTAAKVARTNAAFIRAVKKPSTNGHH